MRLGGPIFQPFDDPDTWVEAVRTKRYRTAGCPLSPDAPAERIAAFRQAAEEADIVIAEVGAWSNPLSPDPEIRSAAIDKCKRSLELAECIGARCCVNIAGAAGGKWDGPHPDNLTPGTFDLMVSTVQDIIDAVQPRETRYSLEAMPWIYPDSADSYLDLIHAIDRPGLAVHLDPVNIINSPQRYFQNADLLRDCFAKLGPRIRSCHAKDILLADKLTVHLDEVRPGLGKLDYSTYLRELDQLDPDIPLLLEHLPDEGEYDLAAAHIRQVALEIGITS